MTDTLRDVLDGLDAFIHGLLIGQDRLQGIARRRFDEARAALAATEEPVQVDNPITRTAQRPHVWQTKTSIRDGSPSGRFVVDWEEAEAFLHAQPAPALDVERLAVESCIGIVQQSLDTVRYEQDRGVTANSPWINGSIGAREHVIRLLEGYRDTVAASQPVTELDVSLCADIRPHEPHDVLHSWHDISDPFHCPGRAASQPVTEEPKP